MKETLRFKLNGQQVDLNVEGDRLLLWVLRTDLGVTGPKYGCGEAMCGACTVLVNNEAVLSCKMPVREVSGAEVLTIEGLEKNGSLHPLQKAFIKHDALQCGYCTPGMILKAYSLLSGKTGISREEIIKEMEGNLCRCGAHTRIIQAIETAAEEMKAGTS